MSRWDLTAFWFTSKNSNIQFRMSVTSTLIEEPFVLERDKVDLTCWHDSVSKLYTWLLLGTHVITGSVLLSSFGQKLHLCAIEDFKDHTEKKKTFGWT